MDLTNSDSLLIELLTEELPPKNLKQLGFAFSKNLEHSLDKFGFLLKGKKFKTEFFVTPRRLAAKFSHVLISSTETFQEYLIPLKFGMTEAGQYTPVFLKRIAKIQEKENHQNIFIKKIFKKNQEYLMITQSLKGYSLSSILQELIDDSIKNLPISKFMQYQLKDGYTTVKFIRPVHRLLVLFGKKVIPLTILGLKSGRETLGHRFMSEGPIQLDNAKDYEYVLSEEGSVIVSFELRRKMILEQLKESANKLDATIGSESELQDLLDEVTGLVEYPVVYAGKFDAKFLGIPQECLILNMRSKQKYFPLFDISNGKLINHFLIVGNIQTSDSCNIISGNQRVLHSRLFDAKFFYDLDLKVKLEDQIQKLNSVIYHNKLGSQYARTERIRSISRYVTNCFGLDVEKSDRAAKLSKADLVSHLVIEFPDLQGIMGAHYAKCNNEPDWVIKALEGQYAINYQGNLSNEKSIASISLFISNRLESLVGIWGIGLNPSGEGDPFGLRRAALGLIDIFEKLDTWGWLKVNANDSLSINSLLRKTFSTFQENLIQPNSLREIRDFIYDRYRYKLIAKFEYKFIDSVISLFPPLNQVVPRIQALMQFTLLPESGKIIATNKRIENLLRKMGNKTYLLEKKFFQKKEEIELAEITSSLFLKILHEYNSRNFFSSLKLLFELNEPVEAFFQNVLIISENHSLRTNRLALLLQVRNCINLIANLSKIN